MQAQQWNILNTPVFKTSVPIGAQPFELTWHWMHIPGLLVEVVAPDVGFVRINFAASIRCPFDEMGVAAFSAGWNPFAPAHPFDQYPEIQGAFWRENVGAAYVRAGFQGSDRLHYAMAHINTVVGVPAGASYISIHGRSRNGNKEGEARVQRPEHNSYGYALDKWSERHSRGLRVAADGHILLEDEWYDAFDEAGPQNHLTLEFTAR